MRNRIANGKYGQDSERELMATKYNITIRVYDAHAYCWIVNRKTDPLGDRVIAILWDGASSHYDMLILEGDNVVSNRSRQLQSILSRCSIQSHALLQLPQENLGLSQSEIWWIKGLKIRKK